MNKVFNVAIFGAGALVGFGSAALAHQAFGKQSEVEHDISTPLAVVKRKNAEVLYSIDESQGHPRCGRDIIKRKAYTAAFDRRLRHPAWTAEHLTLSSLGKSSVQTREDDSRGDRSKSIFAEDESIPSLFRARLSDYFRSGYDRGHMVPAADAKSSQDAMDETFLLSNIAPQVGAGFNRHYWAYVEDFCRRLTTSFADVYVFTVPLYLPKQDADGKWRVTHEVIGDPPNVSVPTHFAKVIITSRPSSPRTPDIPEFASGAFVLPNAPIPDEAQLESFAVPIDAVERAAGLTLLSESIKAQSKSLCAITKCDVLVRRFDDAQKQKKRIQPSQ